MAIKIIPNELGTISLYINQSTRDNRGILYIFHGSTTVVALNSEKWDCNSCNQALY